MIEVQFKKDKDGVYHSYTSYGKDDLDTLTTANFIMLIADALDALNGARLKICSLNDKTNIANVPISPEQDINARKV